MVPFRFAKSDTIVAYPTQTPDKFGGCDVARRASLFLVDLPTARDLLLRAKHLFVAAMATIGKTRRPTTAKLASQTHDEA
jgi:hypothetical protein